MSYKGVRGSSRSCVFFTSQLT